jgi:hypothetical protein
VESGNQTTSENSSGTKRIPLLEALPKASELAVGIRSSGMPAQQIIIKMF